MKLSPVSLRNKLRQGASYWLARHTRDAISAIIRRDRDASPLASPHDQPASHPMGEHRRDVAGHELDEYDRHIRFRLPDPVLAHPGSEYADDTWGLIDGDPMQSSFLMVQHVGCFLRALLPVQLTGGYSVTFGVWIAVR